MSLDLQMFDVEFRLNLLDKPKDGPSPEEKWAGWQSAPEEFRIDRIPMKNC